MIRIAAFISACLMPLIFVLDDANAQYGGPYSFGDGQQQSPAYVDQIPDWQIEKYLSKWKITGVRPSREAYLAVRYYGVHARLILNNFGEDGLAALSKVSGTSAISLRQLIPELKQVEQVSALLRLIASHEEPDRIVQLVMAYRSELVDSPFVEVLLQKPDAVLALGPMAQMPEIIALYDDPAVAERPPFIESQISDWLPSGIPIAGLDKEQITTLLLSGFALVVGIALIVQIRKQLRNRKPTGPAVAQAAPRLTYQSGRPTPAFMRNRGSQTN